MLSFGAFPDVSLAPARSKRDDARKLMAEGINPSSHRMKEKLSAKLSADNTFGSIAEEYLKNLQESNAAEATINENRWLLPSSLK